MASITLYPAAGAVSPVDGYVHRVVTNTAWSTLHDHSTATTATATSTTATLRLISSSISNQYEEISRVILLFDTSVLGATAVISSAALGFYATSKTNGWVSGVDPTLHVVTSTPASNSTIATSDYPNLGTVSQGSVGYTDINTFSYTNIPLIATGIANINTTGITKFGLRWYNDMANVTPTWESAVQLRVNMYMADQTSTDNDPFLQINYTTGSTTVHSVTIPASSFIRKIKMSNY